jgi:hypothetical protein
MYPEVSCPSRLLYSIYTGREAQCNKNQQFICNLFLWHGNQSLGFLFDPRSLPLPSTAPPPGRSISTPPGAAPLFHCGSYWSGGIRRSRVVMQQQIGSSRLSTMRTCRPPLAAHGTPWSSRCTPFHDDGVDHRNSKWRARLCCSAPPRGGRTARGGGLTASLYLWGGCTARRTPGLTASLYVRQAVPGYRDTLRCTRDYPSTTSSL